MEQMRIAGLKNKIAFPISHPRCIVKIPTLVVMLLIAFLAALGLIFFVLLPSS